MIIDELLAVLPSPAIPAESNSKNNWGEITDQIGEPLPTDYMQFIDAYGSGSLNSLISVFNPFSMNRHLNLMYQMNVQLSALRLLKTEFPGEISYPLFFEPGGLLPWAISIDGDVYCWLTKGYSGKWEVVVICRQGGTEHFPMTMSQFLARLIKGHISSASLPNGFSVSEAKYDPIPI
jgi:hypothetical protein